MRRRKVLENGGHGFMEKGRKERNSYFKEFLQYIEDNEQKLSEHIKEPEVEIITVGNEQIECYLQANLPMLGIWIQDEEGVIKIYSYNHMGVEQVGYRTVQYNGEKGPLHQHGCIELGYVIEGCARQSFFGQEYEFHQGDFWIVDRNCFHNDIYGKDRLATVYIGLKPEILDAAFMGKVGNSEIKNFLKTALLEQKEKHQFLAFHSRINNGKGQRLMEQICQEVYEHETGYENIMKGLLERLIECLSMEYEYHMNGENKKIKRKLLFQEMTHYIHEHYTTVTISDLMEEFHYNEEYYNRLFKENTGVTYSEYLKSVRLSYAENSLRTTDLPVEQIMLQVGYQSKTYFYRIFAEQYGMTPAKYRKQCQQR